MPYVAPSTKASNTVLTSTEWNTVVNDIIDLNRRIQPLTTAQRLALTGVTVGDIVYDTTLSELFVYTNATGGNAWQGIGNSLVGTSTTRPTTPFLGQMFYQTDTNEWIKYATDADAALRWMSADRDQKRNLLLNGNFDIVQRGSSWNPASAVSTTKQNYGADRWQFLQATSNSQAFNIQGTQPTDPNGYYYLRVQRLNGATLTTPFTIQQSIESVDVQSRAKNKYITLSFYARAGANYSAASSYLVSNIVTGTGSDNTVGNFTTNTVAATANNVLTTSWKKFVLTTPSALANTITQLGVSFVFTPVGTAGAADYFDICQIQLEPGTAPSDFEFQQWDQTLRNCQRYYYRISTTNGAASTGFGAGQATTATTALINSQFPTRMRAIPTIETVGNASDFRVTGPSGTAINCSALPTITYSSADSCVMTFTVASGLTAGNATISLTNPLANPSISFTAEL